MFNHFFGRVLLCVGLVVITFLQYLIWFGEGGFTDRRTLKKEMVSIKKDIEVLQERNRSLEAEVVDLKTGLEAVEEYARLDLGLVKPGETFIQKSTFIEPASKLPASNAAVLESSASPLPVAATEDVPLAMPETTAPQSSTAHGH